MRVRGQKTRPSFVRTFSCQLWGGGIIHKLPLALPLALEVFEGVSDQISLPALFQAG